MKKKFLIGLTIGILTTLMMSAPNFVCASILTEGLFGYWDMEGNFNDVSGNGHHGTVVGTPTTSLIGSINGQSAVFNGDGYIDIGGVWRGGNTDITMSAWVRTDMVQWNLGYGTVGVGNTGDGAHFYLRSVGHADWDASHDGIHMNLGADNGNTDMWWGSNENVDPEVWYHIVASYNSVTREVRMYIDGGLDRSITLTHELNLGSEIRIGGDAYNDNFMLGMIDDVAIWDRVLSDQEVTRLLAADGSPFAPVPVPSALFLLASGILGLAGVSNRKK